MNVLVLTNMYPTPEKPVYGGFVRDQVEDLRKLGLEVEVLAIAGDRSRLNYAKAVGGLRAALRRRRRDLVHAHYGFSGAVALSQRRVPVIVARGVTPIFVSRERARALGLPGASVIPCGVDTTRFVPIPQTVARSSLGWNDAAPHALFPGARQVALKRFDLFARATALAREALPNLQTACLGDFDRDRIPLVMNAVDATLMTSDSEGSPLAIRESLACQTPVVSVPVGDVPNVLDGLPGCAVVSREPSDLAERLVEAVRAPKDPSLRARAELTSRERVAHRVVALYEAVLDGAQAR
jgi:teichuronic acid biosynthesis glycosyltransferase TuaC